MRQLVIVLVLQVILFPFISAKDLGIRFNKIVLNPLNNLTSIDLPLSAKDYPIKFSTFRWLRYTSASSLLIPRECVECHWDFKQLVDLVGGPPSHPSSKTTDPYWEDLTHVVNMQRLRREGVNPNAIMPLPDLWKNMTIAEVAEAVHDEFPGAFHAELLHAMDKAKTIKVDREIIPLVSVVDFLRGMVMLSDLLTWAIARVGPSNFGLKWYTGRARPEEVAYKIALGNITKGPPAALVSAINALNLTSAPAFTAYPEGSPKHPSWPAMHSAGSAASMWLAVVLDLTPQQWCQIKLTDYAVAYARTVAGVHYVSDNMAGLQLGQEIVAQLLPDFLNERYRSSVPKVKAKIAKVRFDWNDFLDSDCAKGLVV